MNLFGLSPGELLLILLVAMIVLGPEKLPETAASIGRWIREFRRATQELTQQFAEDNPFAEIQRALSFNEPAAPTVATPAAPETAPVAEGGPAAVLPTPVGIATPPAPVASPSDYFTRPLPHRGIDDRWVHGSIDDLAGRLGRLRRPAIAAAIGAEWTHGFPVVVARASVAEPPIDGSVASTLAASVPAVAASLDGAADAQRDRGPDAVASAPPGVDASAHGASGRETGEAPRADDGAVTDGAILPQEPEVVLTEPPAEIASPSPTLNGTGASHPVLDPAEPAIVGSSDSSEGNQS